MCYQLYWIMEDVLKKVNALLLQEQEKFSENEVLNIVKVELRYSKIYIYCRTV